MDVQGEIIVGCLVALTVGILVTSFIPSVREALEPFITTFKEAVLEKLTEDAASLITQKLYKNWDKIKKTTVNNMNE